MTDPITPRDLAREFGDTDRKICVYLRAHWAEGHLHGERWHLTDELAEDVRNKFS